MSVTDNSLGTTWHGHKYVILLTTLLTTDILLVVSKSHIIMSYTFNGILLISKYKSSILSIYKEPVHSDSHIRYE